MNILKKILDNNDSEVNFDHIDDLELLDKYIIRDPDADSDSIDRDLIIAELKRNGLLLEFVKDEIKEDYEIVLAAVSSCGLALKYAPRDLRSDQKIVLAAVNDEPLAIQYASSTIRRDRRVITAAAAKKIYALYYASNKFWEDCKKTITEVMEHGWVIKGVCEDFREVLEILYNTSFEETNNPKAVRSNICFLPRSSFIYNNRRIAALDKLIPECINELIKLYIPNQTTVYNLAEMIKDFDIFIRMRYLKQFRGDTAFRFC